MGVAGAANGRDKVGTQVAEQAMDAALILMIGGLGIYLTIWSGHHVVPYPDGPGEWRSVPRVRRRVLRSGTGPVAIGAVTVQAASATMFLVGLLTYIGVVYRSQSLRHG